jgi:hypothetical protein
MTLEAARPGRQDSVCKLQMNTWLVKSCLLTQTTLQGKRRPPVAHVPAIRRPQDLRDRFPTCGPPRRQPETVAEIVIPSVAFH